MSEKAKNLLHGGYFNPVLRCLQSTNCIISNNNLMYPVFLVDDANAIEAVKSMPDVNRYGVNQVVNALDVLVRKGLSSVLLFGVTQKLEKDERGTNADSPENPVIQGIQKIKAAFPQLVIACDVCLCPYTSHGHCGILNPDQTICNKKSIKRLGEIAFSYAKAGAHIVAPSCMMDGVVHEIKQRLIEDAAKSAPGFGDRKAYQLPIGSAGLAKRAAARDVDEGADMLMVKPGIPYLDVLKQTKDSFPEYPLFVYQVSGEYSMLLLASQAGVLDLKTAVLEVLSSFRRAGADCIISYFTPLILDWMVDNKSNSPQKSIVLSL